MDEQDIEAIGTDEEFVRWMDSYGKFWRRSSYSYLLELRDAFNAGRKYQRIVGGGSVDG